MELPTSYDDYVDKLNTIGDAILDWADPENKFRGHTEGWPLSDFASAFNIALAYFVFVMLGSLIMKLGVPAMDPCKS